MNGCIFNPSLQVWLKDFAVGPRDVFVEPEPEVGSFKKKKAVFPSPPDRTHSGCIHSTEMRFLSQVNCPLESCPEASSPGKCS